MIRKQTRYAVFEFDTARRILFLEITSPVTIDLDIAREMLHIRLEVTEGKPCYVIAESSRVRGITAEAKEYVLRPDGGQYNILGAALIVNNPVAALLANIFIKSRKQYPSRYFTSRAAAVEWIEQLEHSFIRKI